MHRHDGRIRKRVRGLDGVVDVHREIERPARLCRAGEQQHDAGLEATRHLGDAVIPDRVAGDVDRPHARGLEDEADDIAGERFDAGRPVPRRRRGDAQAAAVGRRQVRRLPRRQPERIAAEPLGASLGREHAAGLRQEMAAAVIEIVGVLIVAEQHGIDGAEIVGVQGGASGLGQCDVRQLVVTRLVEGRIGDETETGDFDQHRRAADQSEARSGHFSSPYAARAGRVTR